MLTRCLQRNTAKKIDADSQGVSTLECNVVSDCEARHVEAQPVEALRYKPEGRGNF